MLLKRFLEMKNWLFLFNNYNIIRMTITNILLTLGVLTIAGGTVYYLYKNRGRKVRLAIQTEIVDDIISLKQLTAFFKTLDLQEGTHIPFLVLADGLEKLDKFEKKTFPEKKEGYICLIAGVYEDIKDVIEKGKVFYVKGFDDELKKVFGKETLILLS